jgi:DNA/RNA endonuclease G (NUC1)
MTEQLVQAFKKKKNILYLKKNEFDIFYLCKEKYPAVVISKITDKTGETISTNKIKRSDIVDPFKKDKAIPKEYQMTLKDYKKYMEYGGSLGHNTPAGHHKTNIETYNETFLLSNISPQEITFNTGLWLVLETWTKKLQDEPELENITVFTGNIPSKKEVDFNGVMINVPDYMYKLVACKHKENPNNLYIACFLMKNEPPETKIHKIYKHLVSLKELTQLADVNFFKMFSHYLGFNPKKTKITSMNKILRLDVKFDKRLARQMISSLYYGKIIYSKTLTELDKNWELAVKSGFDTEFHLLYYKYAKKRIKSEMKSLSSKMSTKSKKTSKKASKTSLLKKSEKTQPNKTDKKIRKNTT